MAGVKSPARSKAGGPVMKAQIKFKSIREYDIIEKIRDFYESNAWEIIKDVNNYDVIVNRETGEVLPYLIRLNGGNYEVLKPLEK